ncbi:MAG: helix-turn-helix domain-containing protein [Bacteroidota bacterium]
MIESRIKHIETLPDLCKLAGLPPPEHPLIGIIRLEDIPIIGIDLGSLSFGFYSISLKRNLKGYIEYGRKQYDFQEGLLGFVAPNQAITFDQCDATNSSGWELYFESDLLANSKLATDIQRYGFFNYETSEALHVSKKEEDQIDQIFQNIYDEYSLPIDQFSKEVILSNLELLLTYSKRFYQRQFITRNEVDSSVVSNFEKELNAYFSIEDLQASGIPGVSYFSDKLSLSSKYLSDLLKTLTGKTTKEHIQFQLLKKAKHLILGTDKSVAEIAYQLGFEYPQYFSRFFKEKTGESPKEYRMNK